MSEIRTPETRVIATFNDFEDVRAWVATHSYDALRRAHARGDFAGKTHEVAEAYIAHVEEHGYDLVEDDDEDDDPPWVWKPWRIAIVALFVLGPPLLVWAINAWRG